MTDENDEKITAGTLKIGEPHPSSYEAYRYLIGLGMEKLMTYLGSFSSCALAENRPAEICADTLNRLLKNEPTSDRYLLGLAWAIRDMEEGDKKSE